VFLISRGEIIERFDAIYYSASNSLKIANETTYPIKKLSDVAILQRGRFSHRPRNDERFYHGNYPFIQTGDIVRASETNDTIEFTQTLNERGLSVSKLFKPDILIITIAANIGDTAILTYPACFPDSLVTITPKNELVDVRYLNIYFKYVKDYLVNLAPQAAQKNINLQQLSPTPIVVPPIETQSNIIALFEAAYQTKRQKETKAAELLANIDGYLLNELGVTLPQPSEKKTYFMSNSGQVSGGRFDPFYHQGEFIKLEQAISESKFEKCVLQKNLIFLESGSRPSGGVSQYENGVLSFGGEHINDKCEIEIKTPKYIPVEYHQNHLLTETKLHDIILVKDGATTGKIGIIHDEIHTKKNVNEHVFMMRFNESVNPFFILNLLASSIYQKLIGKAITGATVTGLTKGVIKNLIIPLPPLEKQTEIADHIRAIRAKAKQLQHEAKAELEQVKSVIEKMILGEQYE
jgi:restriction endonuclease S subunit